MKKLTIMDFLYDPLILHCVKFSIKQQILNRNVKFITRETYQNISFLMTLSFHLEFNLKIKNIEKQ